jgi:hypothetical protein
MTLRSDFLFIPFMINTQNGTASIGTKTMAQITRRAKLKPLGFCAACEIAAGPSTATVEPRSRVKSSL